jgi:hypothetical protein
MLSWRGQDVAFEALALLAALTTRCRRVRDAMDANRRDNRESECGPTWWTAFSAHFDPWMASTSVTGLYGR